MSMNRLGILLLAGCASQVLNMDRTSSGAVDRDIDFTPLPGTDGHFISLPAYPLVNCTDTLIYDRLGEQMFLALGHVTSLATVDLEHVGDQFDGDKDRGRILAAIKFAKKLKSSAFGKLVLSANGDPATIAALRTLAQNGRDLERRRLPAAQLAQPEREDLDASYKAIDALQVKPTPSSELLSLLAKPTRSDADKVELERRSIAFSKATEGLFEDMLAATNGNFFVADDVLRFVHDQTLADALATFVAFGVDYGVTPCSTSLRYRDFLGYDPTISHDVTWLDRTKDQQLQALETIAKDTDTRIVKNHEDVSTSWPVAELSFLHFSDVQIREPGAKLGGAHLSRQLKGLVSSFEQDYVQEQYAVLVYDAIIKTANAEICLGNPKPVGCESNNDAPAVDESRPAPTLMIHTGDSADTGMQSEFDTFVKYNDQLHVPWYQAIGNHDVLAFGNLRLTSVDLPNRPEDDKCHGWGRIGCTCTNLNTLVRNQELRYPDNRGKTKDALPDSKFTLFPILLQRICLLHAVAADWFVMDPDKTSHGNALHSFVYSHCRNWHPKPGDPKADADFEKCMNEPGADPRYARRPATGDVVADVALDRCATLDNPAPSKLHGFDLQPNFDAERSADLRGYYCFEVSPPGEVNDKDQSRKHRTWAVVLNTNTDAGAFGFISDAQLKWLRELLPRRKCDRREHDQIGCDDFVMIFTHHPIYAIYDQRQRLELTDIVTESPNVIGYFAGHTHESGLRTIRPLLGSRGHAKWEIVAPSVIDYPQAARQVTIKTAGTELGYIEVLTFTPHGRGESVSKIEAASRGAVRDMCLDASKCDNGNARLPGREVTFPRVFFRTPASVRASQH